MRVAAHVMNALHRAGAGVLTDVRPEVLRAEVAPAPPRLRAAPATEQHVVYGAAPPMMSTAVRRTESTPSRPVHELARIAPSPAGLYTKRVGFRIVLARAVVRQSVIRAAARVMPIIDKRGIAL